MADYLGAPSYTAPPFPSSLPPQGQYGHWDYPDYAGLLQKWMQPYQQQYQGELQAQRAQANTNTQLAQQRYSTGPTSTLARIKKAEDYAAFQNRENQAVREHEHQKILMGLTNALAARGLLSSGETGYQQGEEAFRFGHLTDAQKQAYGQQQYGFQTQRADANNQLLDYLRGIQQALADAQRQGVLGLAQKQQDIANMLSQIYRPTWVDETPSQAPTPAQWAGFSQTGIPGAFNTPWSGPTNQPYPAPAASSYNFPTPGTVPIRNLPEGI